MDGECHHGALRADNCLDCKDLELSALRERLERADEELEFLRAVHGSHDNLAADPNKWCVRMDQHQRMLKEYESELADLRARNARMAEALEWALKCFDGLVREELLGGSEEADAELEENLAPIRAALDDDPSAWLRARDERIREACAKVAEGYLNNRFEGRTAMAKALGDVVRALDLSSVGSEEDGHG